MINQMKKIAARIVTAARPGNDILVEVLEITHDPKDPFEKDEFDEIMDSVDVSGAGSAGSPWVVEYGNIEWLGFKSYEDAERAALDRVTEDLESEPELFTQSWLENFVRITDTDRRIMAGEEADFYAEDMSDDDVLDQAGMSGDMDDLEEQYDDEEIDEDTYNDKREALIDKARDEVRDDIYEMWYDGLANPVDFLVNDQGLYTIEDLFSANFIYIDSQEAAKAAVAADGVAHFLSSYNGDETEIDGTYWYRVN